MEFLIGGLIIAVVIAFFAVRKVCIQDDEITGLKHDLLTCEDIITKKNKETTNLKRQIQDMYKTIDEYTAEKDGEICENEVCEKALKKTKKAK